MKRLLAIAVAALLSLSAAPAALAQSAGATIRVIFPFAAGGSGDALARLVAERLQAALNQTVVVENRTGAAGQIGVTAVKNAPADDTTLLITPFAAMTIYPFVYKKLDYNPVTDFKPVSQLTTFDFGIAVGPGVPAKTPAELVAWLKANPAKANYGSPGAGALPHFFGLLFGKAAGVEMTHVPYRGTAPALPDLVSGQITMLSTTVSDLAPLHKDGKIRIIATSDVERSEIVPEVPTFKESGINIAGTGWYGLFAPAGASAGFVQRVNTAVVAALRAPELKARLQALGLKVTATSPAELAAIQKHDAEQWAPIVKASGFTAD